MWGSLILLVLPFMVGRSYYFVGMSFGRVAEEGAFKSSAIVDHIEVMALGEAYI